MVETPAIKSKAATSEWGLDSGGRLKGTTIVKPIVYGSTGRHMGIEVPPNQGKHTHSWTVYLKPYKNEDMSSYVKKVQFKLHDSYAESQRVVTTPPYEVQETGWGEFEIQIKIYFVDPNERPVTIYHYLKLFHGDHQAMGGHIGPPFNTKPVVSEAYEEIVFQDPSIMMHQILTAPPKPFAPSPYTHETDFAEKERRTTHALAQARKKVRNEILTLQKRLKQHLEVKAKIQEQVDKLSLPQ